MAGTLRDQSPETSFQMFQHGIPFVSLFAGWGTPTARPRQDNQHLGVIFEDFVLWELPAEES
jgi:hypothetical protein